MVVHQQQELRTLCMAVNSPKILIKGIDKVIKRDLGKHKNLLIRAKLSLQSFKQATSHLIKKKKHYSGLVGGGKFKDPALKESISMINVDIRAMSDKVKLANEEIEHHTLIVDTLTDQLEEYRKNDGITA